MTARNSLSRPPHRKRSERGLASGCEGGCFQFTDGYGLHCTVFLARDFTGELIETDEATPIWFDLAAIPYHEMWADDQHWLPPMLAGQRFMAWFEFDGERMLSKDVRLEDIQNLPSS